MGWREMRERQRARKSGRGWESKGLAVNSVRRGVRDRRSPSAVWRKGLQNSLNVLYMRGGLKSLASIDAWEWKKYGGREKGCKRWKEGVIGKERIHVKGCVLWCVEGTDRWKMKEKKRYNTAAMTQWCGQARCMVEINESVGFTH